MTNRTAGYFLAPLLAFALLAASLSACAPPSRDKLVKVAGYGAQLSALLEANYTLPDTLLAQGVITQQKHDQIVAIFSSARGHIGAFNAGMKSLLASDKPDFAALTSAVADIIGDVQRLDANVQSDAYKKTLAAIEISLRAIATYFSLQIKQARAAGMSDRQLARFLPLHASRAIENYAFAGH